MIHHFKKNTYRSAVVSSLIIFSLIGLSAVAYLSNQEPIGPVLNASAEVSSNAIASLNKVNPLQGEELTVLSSYGEKSHPVLKTIKKHTGVDLKGTLGESI